MKHIIIYLIAINLITFLLFFIDKQKAIKKKWRISEAALFGISALGGALGGIAAMEIFRHKTQTPLFKYGMPVLSVLQIALTVYLFIK